jgi:MFS family permease
MDESKTSPLRSGNEPGRPPEAGTWYQGITRYQWLILAIASAGWIFDVYEGQIFNITRAQLLADILNVSGSDPAIHRYGDLFLGIFLLGGTVGGLLFGSLADRIGRRPTMILTILMYSIFSGLTYFAQDLWHVAVLRFLVAMGVGGEWAVAASLVAEVFPTKARAHAAGIFHSSSILGTWLAALAGMAVGAQWRYAYLLGVLPALLILWVRVAVKEPEKWKEAGARAASGTGPKMGSFRDLLLNPRWAARAIFGMLLAAVGLGTFWAITVAGQNLAHEMLIRTGKPVAGIEARDGQNTTLVTRAEHHLRTGDAVSFAGATAGFPSLADNTSLRANVTYYARALDAHQLSLHASKADAEAGRSPLEFAGAQASAGDLKLIAGRPPAERSKFAYGIVQTAGGGLGLLCFGPLCARFGRRKAFMGIHIAAFLIVPITCYAPATYNQLLMMLPVFGFLTLGMHAGYAIYFPELFPNHLRATGAGFCFNVGRVMAASVLYLSSWLKSLPNMDLRLALSLLSVLFLLGLVIVMFLPETKDQPLPE